MEILLQKVGSPHLESCELRVTLKPAPYGKYAATKDDTEPAANNPPATPAPAAEEPKEQ